MSNFNFMCNSYAIQNWKKSRWKIFPLHMSNDRNYDYDYWLRKHWLSSESGTYIRFIFSSFFRLQRSSSFRNVACKRSTLTDPPFVERKCFCLCCECKCFVFKMYDMCLSHTKRSDDFENRKREKKEKIHFESGVVD